MYMYAYAYAYVHMYMHICIYIYGFSCVYTHIHIYVCTQNKADPSLHALLVSDLLARDTILGCSLGLQEVVWKGVGAVYGPSPYANASLLGALGDRTAAICLNYITRMLLKYS